MLNKNNDDNIKRQGGKIKSNQKGIFSRISWDTKYYFRWCKRDNIYAYCTKNGKFINAHYHDHDRSHVGNSVLSADDLYRVESNKKSNKEIKIMDKNYIGSYNTVVRVVVHDSRGRCELYYKVSDKFAENLEVGDKVIVDSDRYKIQTVDKIITRGVHIDAIRSFNASKAWVVCKIDDTEHKERIANSERRKFIITQLDEKKKEVEEIQIYNMLAEMDPEANKLLVELKKLTKS